MENIGIYGIKDIDTHSLIQDTIKEVNTSMSLLCDTLVEEAERNTTTLEEYKAFMKGAAFVFRCVAKRNEPNKYGTPQTISTIQSAITHNEAIKELSKSDWISVEDKLPEYDERVLVYSKYKELYWISYRMKDTCIRKDHNGFIHPIDEFPITHWKPIEKLEE